MNKSLALITATAIILLFAATSAFAQSQAVPASGPARRDRPPGFCKVRFPIQKDLQASLPTVR
jgi:hypothetical protein